MGSTARARLSRWMRACAAAEGGFTLPELLTAMAILVIVLTSLTAGLVTATQTQTDVDHRFQAQEQARTGLDLLRHELHCGTSVTDTSGNPLTAGTAYSAITVSLSSVCPTTGLPSTSTLTTYATWCTSASTATNPAAPGDYALYRVTTTALPRPTCASAGAVQWMDYLTTSTPFCLPNTVAACSGVKKPSASLSAVATAPVPASSGTSLTVTSGQGSRFPTTPFEATIWPAGSVPSSSNAEIVLVTAIATDTLTITRAQEGTTARTVVIGDQIAATSLPMLHVTFPVNLNGPTSTKASYNLVDDIALRNGARS
jgi:prepilin-type N-terminal cleavage/methylation domain-containing protein